VTYLFVPTPPPRNGHALPRETSLTVAAAQRDLSPRGGGGGGGGNVNKRTQ